MNEIHTVARGMVAELRAFEEQWFNFEPGFTDDAPAPSLETGEFDFEPIKELLNTLRLGRLCALPRLLTGASQYKIPVEYTIVNLNPELDEKFQFDHEGCTLLIEELCEWTVEIRPLDENGTSVRHSFTPIGKGAEVVWLAHWSFHRKEDLIVNREKYGKHQLESFCSHIDLYEDERLVGRVPVRYPLGKLFPYNKSKVSVLRGESVLSLPTPDLHHDSLRWFSSDNGSLEVAQHLPQEVGETTYYLKGWCRDEERWIQVIDDDEAPVTWSINVTDWDFQDFIDSISFQRSADEKGIFLKGEWCAKGKLPSTIRENTVAAESMDGFSVEIRRNSIDIRCHATNGYSTPVEFQINGFDDVANRTFDFPPEVDFGAEALDCIAVTLITRNGNIIAIDYDTTQLPEGLSETIHLWVGSNHAIEIPSYKHKMVRLNLPFQTASIVAESSWHPYGKDIKQELTMVSEKTTRPPTYALDHNKKYLAWHPELLDLSNQALTGDALGHHLFSVNTELELGSIHDATLRPLLFQFHEDGQTTVHKLTPFDSTYEEAQPYYILYDENSDDLKTLKINNGEFFNADQFIGPKGGLLFSKPGHYIVAFQPHPRENTVLGGVRYTANHYPMVDYDRYHYGSRYTTVVCIEVV